MKASRTSYTHSSQVTNSPKNILQDTWGRKIDYLRIAVTDRCNLRCFYCMPSESVQYMPKRELLTYEEILRLARIFSSLGIKKIRLTGGEPFLRKDFISLVKNLKHTEGIDKVHITTNGVLTYPYLDQLRSIGVDGVNLSLDSLDRDNFLNITKRDDLDTVLRTLEGLLERKIDTKINMVVMHGKNTQEIIAMAQLTKSYGLSVRFIEEMPFNGSKKAKPQENWNYRRILQELQINFPELKTIDTLPSSPATLYQIPDYLGHIGIIPAYSRTFCHACNRIRLTATGTIKNCLYDEGVLDIKRILREDQANDEAIARLITNTIHQKEKNGIIAEKKRQVSPSILESMSTIGG